MSGINITVYDGQNALDAALRAETAAKKAEEIQFYNLRNELPAPEGTILPSVRPDNNPVQEGDFMEVNKNDYTNLDTSSLSVLKDKGRLYFNGIKWIVSLEWDLPLPEGVSTINPEGEDLPKEKAVANYVEPMITDVKQDVGSLSEDVLVRPSNNYVRSNIVEGFYIDATTGVYAPSDPSENFATTGWINLQGKKSFYVSGNTAGVGARFKDSQGNLMKPLSEDGSTEQAFFRLPKITNVIVPFPVGATDFEMIVKFLPTGDSSKTLLIEDGSTYSTRINPKIIPELKLIENTVDAIVSGEGVLRENKFENTINPRYFDDVAYSGSKFQIDVIVDIDSPTKDKLGFRRLFIANPNIANKATQNQTAAIILGANRPEIMSFGMWIRRSQFADIFKGNFTSYLSLNQFTASAPAILAGQTVVSGGSSTVNEYDTAQCEFKIIEESGDWIRLRITYFDIVWKPTFTGSAINFLWLFNQGDFLGKTFDFADFTVLFGARIQQGVFYGDPDGAYSPDPISLKSLSGNIENVNNRVEELENKTFSSGRAKILLKNNVLYFASPWSEDRLLVKNIIVSRPTGFDSNANINFVNSYLSSKQDIKTSIVPVKAENDDIAPAGMQGGHIGGNHGWFQGALVTVAGGHNKTLADVGSRFVDTLGINFTLIRVVSPTQLIVYSDNQSTEQGVYDFDTPTGTLIYLSDGSNTSDISGYTFDGSGNLYPTVSQSETKMYCDGIEVVDFYDGYGDVFEIHERYNVFDLPHMLELLTQNRPTEGYTDEVHFNEVGARTLFWHDIVYRLTYSGLTLVMTRLIAENPLVNQFHVITQVQPMTGSSTRLYIPKSLPISDSAAKIFDFDKISDWSVAPSSQLYLTSQYWKDPLSPPDRCVMFNNTASMHVGYIMDKGIATERISRITHAFHLATSRKLYPKIVSLPFNMVKGDNYTGIAFRNYNNPALNPNGRFNYSFVEFSGKVYIWADYDGAIKDHLKVQPEWSGMNISIVEKSDNVMHIGDVVTDSITIWSEVLDGETGYVYLLLTWN